MEKRLGTYFAFKYQKRDFKDNLGFKFFFIPSQFRLDIFEELANLLKQRYEPILLSPTYEELLMIAEKGSPKMRQEVSMALKLIEKCQVVSVEQKVDETHDDVIVRLASEWKCPVATNDRVLRKRLRHINVPVIYLRQKSRFEMEGGMH